LTINSYVQRLISIQAVQRDLKKYIAKHSSRKIPVGYSAADVRDILQDTWAYLQCNNKDDGSSSDFFGLNSYSWCGGDATFQTSGYVDLVTMFNQSAIPVFVSRTRPEYLSSFCAIVNRQAQNSWTLSAYPERHC
jgi:hypothetical protein